MRTLTTLALGAMLANSALGLGGCASTQSRERFGYQEPTQTELQNQSSQTFGQQHPRLKRLGKDTYEVGESIFWLGVYTISTPFGFLL